jgi:hypothetical protein
MRGDSRAPGAERLIQVGLARESRWGAVRMVRAVVVPTATTANTAARTKNDERAQYDDEGWRRWGRRPPPPED